MNKVYGFEGECKSKHGEMTYKLFTDVFTARELTSLCNPNSQFPSLPSCLPARLPRASSPRAPSPPSSAPMARSATLSSTAVLPLARTVSPSTRLPRLTVTAASPARRVSCARYV